MDLSRRSQTKRKAGLMPTAGERTSESFRWRPMKPGTCVMADILEELSQIPPWTQPGSGRVLYFKGPYSQIETEIKISHSPPFLLCWKRMDVRDQSIQRQLRNGNSVPSGTNIDSAPGAWPAGFPMCREKKIINCTRANGSALSATLSPERGRVVKRAGALESESIWAQTSSLWH